MKRERFPFPHLCLGEVYERESLIARLKAGRMPWWSPDYIRLNALIARTSSACNNYPRQRIPEPEEAA